MRINPETLQGVEFIAQKAERTASAIAGIMNVRPEFK